jgi:hypothetical protein
MERPGAGSRWGVMASLWGQGVPNSLWSKFQSSGYRASGVDGFVMRPQPVVGTSGSELGAITTPALCESFEGCNSSIVESGWWLLMVACACFERKLSCANISWICNVAIFQIILVCGYTLVTADYDMLVQEIELQKDLSVSATTFKSSLLIT